MTDDLRARAQEIAEATGASVDELLDRAVASYQGYSFGERVMILEDDEDKGNYAGDEGWLVFQEVGAPQYHNVRVSPGFINDYHDSPIDVDLSNVDPL